MIAARGLGIVFYQAEMMALANVGNALGIGTATIEMDNHDGSRARGDGLLDECVVYLEGLDVGLHQDGNEIVVRNGQYGSNIGVGRNDDLVALAQDTYFFIRAKDEPQGIQSIGHSHAMLATDVLGIVRLEVLILTALKEPSGVDHPIDSRLYLFAMHLRDGL